VRKSVNARKGRTVGGLLILLGTAATVGLVHTVLGPDHYVPFIALSQARRWTARKTALVTIACGIGHVGSSVALGFVGIGLGIALFRVQAIEAHRGDVAAWLLLGFGFAYFVWGLHRAIRNRPHEHAHIHPGGIVHRHEHTHTGEHSHVHAAETQSVTPWILFLIFVFGPCEPLIPLVMYPAAEGHMAEVGLVAGAFSVTTIGAMLGIVMGAHYGLTRFHVGGLTRYAHALAGLTILACGAAVKFLGL
jgi:nickel/cobalt exporter